MDKMSDLFTRDNTWIDDSPLPMENPQHFHDIACSVCFDDGVFPLTGSGPCSLTEKADVIVTPMRKLSSQTAPNLDDIILEDKAALLAIKGRLLSIFVKKEPDSNLPWHPLTAANTALMLDQPIITKAVAPRRHESWPLVYMSIYITCHWNWRL